MRLEEELQQEGFEIGTIQRFEGSWGSGLAFLLVDGVPIPCDNSQTVRSLDDCFGDVITEDHCVNQKAIEGKRIAYKMDDFGITMEMFIPL